MQPQPTYNIPPEGENFETSALLKMLVSAHRHLAELKGCTKSTLNQGILIAPLLVALLAEGGQA